MMHCLRGKQLQLALLLSGTASRPRYSRAQLVNYCCLLQGCGAAVALDRQLYDIQQLEGQIGLPCLLALFSIQNSSTQIQNQYFNLVLQRGFQSTSIFQPEGFVVEAAWLKEWFSYCKQKKARPFLQRVLREVSNNLLQHEYQTIVGGKKQYGRDYYAVSERVWTAFSILYGSTAQIKYYKNAAKLVRVTLFDGRDFNEAIKISMPATTTLKSLQKIVKLQAARLTKEDQSKLLVYVFDKTQFVPVSEPSLPKDVSLGSSSLLFVIVLSAEHKSAFRIYLRQSRVLLGQQFQLALNKLGGTFKAQVVEVSSDKARVHILSQNYAHDMVVDRAVLAKVLHSQAKGVPVVLDCQDQFIFHRGFKNVGNSCYVNVALQVLLNFSPFKNFVRNFDPDQYGKSSSQLALSEGLNRLVRNLACNKQVDMRAFFSVLEDRFPAFQGRSQQDVQEFITLLLEGVSQEVRDSTCSYNFVNDAFSGQLQDAIVCEGCKDTIRKKESFFTLSLPVLHQTKTELRVALVDSHSIRRTVVLRVPRHQLTFQKLIQQFQGQGIDSAKYLVAELVDGHLSKVIVTWSGKSLVTLHSDTILVYERRVCRYQPTELRVENRALCDYRDTGQFSLGIIKTIRDNYITVEDLLTGKVHSAAEVAPLGLRTANMSRCLFYLQCQQAASSAEGLQFHSFPFLLIIQRFLNVRQICTFIQQQLSTSLETAEFDVRLLIKRKDQSLACFVCLRESASLLDCRDCMQDCSRPFCSFKNYDRVKALVILKDGRNFINQLPQQEVKQKSKMKLEDCLAKYFQRQSVEFQCEKCEGRQATISHCIGLMPNVLMLHLNRFASEYNELSKVDTAVQFPLELDMGRFEENGVGSQYQLNSAVLHRGTLATGHYMVLLRDEHGRWLMANDQQVRLASVGLPEQHQSVYLLTYHKKARAGSVALFSL